MSKIAQEPHIYKKKTTTDNHLLQRICNNDTIALGLAQFELYIFKLFEIIFNVLSAVTLCRLSRLTRLSFEKKLSRYVRRQKQERICKISGKKVK